MADSAARPAAAVTRLARGEDVLAYAHTAGRSPTVVFLPGYASNMDGTKALYLEQACRREGQAFLRLDYRGHGRSSGRFVDGTLGEWAEDARAVVEAATSGPLLLVGSSMGGWIMLLLARALAARVVGLVGIAAAPDFGDDVWAALDVEQRARLQRTGLLSGPSAYGPEPWQMTLRFIEESRRHNQLHDTIPLRCPVRLLHGIADPDVPWRKALTLGERLAAEDVRLTLLKGAGHRLSAPHELELVAATVAALCEQLDRAR